MNERQWRRTPWTQEIMFNGYWALSSTFKYTEEKRNVIVHDEPSYTTPRQISNKIKKRGEQ